MSHFALRAARLSTPACVAIATILLLSTAGFAAALAADHPGQTPAVAPRTTGDDAVGARWRQAPVPWTGTNTLAEAKARIAANPNDPAGWLDLAAAQCRAGDYAAAAKTLEEARQKTAPSADLLYLLGAVYAQQDRLADAEAATRGALTLQPKHVGAHCQLGIIFGRIGWHESAVESFEDALAVAPESLPAQLGLVGALIEAGHAAAGEKAAREFLGRTPREAALWVALGEALEARENLKEAFAAYGRALAEDSKCADAYARRAHLFCRMGQFEAAQNECRTALSFAPDHPLAHAYLGVACAYLGQKEEARRHALTAEQAGLHMGSVWEKLGK